jgi:hypothetical protein
MVLHRNWMLLMQLVPLRLLITMTPTITMMAEMTTQTMMNHVANNLERSAAQFAYDLAICKPEKISHYAGNNNHYY